MLVFLGVGVSQGYGVRACRFMWMEGRGRGTRTGLILCKCFVCVYFDTRHQSDPPLEALEAAGYSMGYAPDRILDRIQNG